MTKLSKAPGHTFMNSKETKAWIGIETEDRQFQKMSVLGQLMCGVAHDFNNILTAILSFTELAKLSGPQGSGSHLAGVTQAAHRGRDLVQQILRFGGQREEEPRPINLASVISEVLQLLHVSLPPTIKIDREKMAQSSIVLADPIQMSQILMNLCLNGAQSMSPTGGVLEVSLLEVEINWDNLKDFPDLMPGSYVRLRVRDSGSGIPPEMMERIFDPFFTTKKSGEGTGMGLAVVQDIVERHQGIILVDSVLGYGTTFDIYLPQIGEVFDIQKDGDVPVSKGKECILFVDNERPICELIQEKLKGLGYTIITQTNSQDALDMFLKTPDQFDLVMTDLSMPKMSGERLVQNILSIRSDIPIILCTGRNQAFADECVRALGAKGSVLKPFAENAVAKTIRQALDRASEERSLRNITTAGAITT